MAVHTHPCASGEALAEALGADIAQRLRDAVMARGQAVLAVSGGKSPIALFTALRSADLPWAQVTVTLVDERVVPSDHVDSNARLVREHLLQDRAQVAPFVPLVDATGDLPPTPQLLRQAQARWAPLPHADVVVLGMGEDGHTASLFPEATALAAGLSRDNTQRLLAVQPLKAAHTRLSMSLNEILAARSVLLSLGGAAKHAVYRQASVAADVRLPISFVLNATHPDVHVWTQP